MAITDVPTVSSLPLDLVELRHKRRESALTQLVAAAETAGIIRDADVLLASLLRAQRLGSTAMGRGLAVPHARSFAVNRPAMLLGRSLRGVDWGAEDGLPVQVVALVLSPAATPMGMHVERVAAALHTLRLQRTRQRLLDLDVAGVVALLRGGGA
jgi:mannitol/fructose-specific phosphotransferase system IIA component (Ntr-type)